METGSKHAPAPPVRAATTLLLLVLLLLPFGSPASGGDELVSSARSRNRVLIAGFGLGLCRQCKAQSEILDRIRAAYEDKVVVGMVHVLESSSLVLVEIREGKSAEWKSLPDVWTLVDDPQRLETHVREEVAAIRKGI